MVMVPRTASESAMVIGIRSPRSWTRRITNWPAWRLRATRGASIRNSLTSGARSRASRMENMRLQKAQSGPTEALTPGPAVTRTGGPGGKQDRIRISPVVSMTRAGYAPCVSGGRDEDSAPPSDSPLHRPFRRMPLRGAFPAPAGPPGRRVPEVRARGRLGANLRQAACGPRGRAAKGAEGGTSRENTRRLIRPPRGARGARR